MLQTLSSKEVTELLAYNYTLTDEFKRDMKKQAAPQQLKSQFADRVVKKNA